MSDPPEVFPNASSSGDVRVLENPVYVSELSGTEMDDMRNESFYKKPPATSSTTPTTPTDAELLESVKATIAVNVSPKEDAEYIENGEDTEEARLWRKEHRSNGLPIVRGQLAAILAGLFVAMAVLGYLGLMSWRRYLE